MIWTFSPWRWHRSIQRWLNMPNRAARTVSPGERVLEIAASQPPVPVDGKHDHFARVHLQHAPHPFDRRLEDPREGGAAVVERWHVAGLAN
jgi:hypothetical protein